MSIEYRETFNMQTPDCLLLWTANVDLVKLCGLMRIKILQSAHFCWPDDTGKETALPAIDEALPRHCRRQL